MTKFAVFVFSDNETKEGLGRVVNAMESVKELSEANHDVKLFFDGYGKLGLQSLQVKIILRMDYTKQ